MQRNVYGKEWERALQKYDELAIRYDQMKKVFKILGENMDKQQPKNLTEG